MTGSPALPLPLAAVPPPAPDERELMLRAAAGSADAFDTLFRRHRRGLLGFLYRRLRSYEEAEDAVALTFANAWRARTSYRGSAAPKVWLYRIGTRVAIDLQRRRRSRPADCPADIEPLELDLEDLRREVLRDPSAALVEMEKEEEVRRAVLQAMSRLREEERDLLRLFYFECLSYDEISGLLGVSRSQVRGRLHRIRDRLRRHLPLPPGGTAS